MRMTITSAQSRLARALLDWTLDDTAAKSGTNKRSLSNFETGKTGLIAANMTLLAKAYEDAGVRFIPGGAWLDEKSDGVRLKQSEGTSRDGRK